MIKGQENLGIGYKSHLARTIKQIEVLQRESQNCKYSGICSMLVRVLISFDITTQSMQKPCNIRKKIDLEAQELQSI